MRLTPASALGRGAASQGIFCRPHPWPCLQYREACWLIAQQSGVPPLPEAQHQSPFTVILPPQLVDALMAASSSSDGSGAAASEEAAMGQPDVAKDLSEASSSDGGSSSETVETLLAELRGSAPIWQHPPQLVCFSADRPTAKALAKQLAEGLQQLPTSTAAGAAAA